MSNPEIAPSLLERWRRVPAAVIADVSAGACLIDPDIRPLCPAGQQPRMFGRAVTALCAPPDFGAVLRALDVVKPGDVLVIAAQGHRDHAMIGEILGGHLRRLKAAGVVCDGAVRDVGELAGWKDLSVYARYITPMGPTGASEGTFNVPVSIGDNLVHPGDLLIGDDDGVCVLNASQARDLIAAVEAKLVLEGVWQKKLAGGQTIAATFGLDVP